MKQEEMALDMPKTGCVCVKVVKLKSECLHVPWLKCARRYQEFQIFI